MIDIARSRDRRDHRRAHCVADLDVEAIGPARAIKMPNYSTDVVFLIIRAKPG